MNVSGAALQLNHKLTCNEVPSPCEMLQSVTETNPTEPKSSKPKSNLVPHHILNVFSLCIQYKVYRTRLFNGLCLQTLVLTVKWSCMFTASWM